MNEIIRVIKRRRSIRKFKDEQIADSEVQEILNSALLAPNAMNRQKLHFTLIQNKNLLDKMAQRIKENMLDSRIAPLVDRASSPDYNTFYNAPTVILISGEGKAPFIQIDCGAAAQNITLASESLNIGSCLITSSGYLFSTFRDNDLKNELGIPTGYSHICTVALGYKTGEDSPTPPRRPDVVNHIR
ncbi:MAG TPA: nitroreductase [Desulfotomaculum sp.]|nr:MAG: Nitroreductase [Desulfotomaculum sp. 46_80]HAG11072.1 nitroreductase [Desulfotomaculum sp.]HBY03614.1 nitroreductase [Desulfotomaculum sp.]